MTEGPELLTVGHGRLDGTELSALLLSAGVGLVVDIRRFPGSRHNPGVAREPLEARLADDGIGYRWDARLGGRRTSSAGASADPWWQVAAFRAYAEHTRTPEFEDGLRELLESITEHRTAVMCSESVWWRCHRRIVADVVALTTDVPVRHLMHDGRRTEHPPSDGARVTGDHLVVWDGSP
ncbi:hypothetical protein ASE12_07390 [Aeromicrobium sp. Root236]|uniref:DUF488 domain-containing protein n=1 Tax=Aeromicrobium sp. Root236 TaxID=1736498 RepID=UPI0006FAE25D|nr:DUF488 domain-containing protein [Aeromicrobium sp. Root236]KRC64603.1 hypothetical protein ASE12_07390 [Aeromicrobium sp. Root236]